MVFVLRLIWSNLSWNQFKLTSCFVALLSIYAPNRLLKLIYGSNNNSSCMIMFIQMVFQHSMRPTRTILRISNHYIVSAQIKTRAPLQSLSTASTLTIAEWKYKTYGADIGFQRIFFLLDTRQWTFISIIKISESGMLRYLEGLFNS